MATTSLHLKEGEIEMKKDASPASELSDIEITSNPRLLLHRGFKMNVEFQLGDVCVIFKSSL